MPCLLPFRHKSYANRTASNLRSPPSKGDDDVSPRNYSVLGNGRHSNRIVFFFIQYPPESCKHQSTPICKQTQHNAHQVDNDSTEQDMNRHHYQTDQWRQLSEVGREYVNRIESYSVSLSPSLTPALSPDAPTRVVLPTPE